jgi:hypothetical protein
MGGSWKSARVCTAGDRHAQRGVAPPLILLFQPL